MPVSPVSVAPNLESALSRAGARNGVDFSYLLQTAIRESALDPRARAATSSAVGLFQFVEQTWLEVIKEQGPALGYGELARHVAVDAEGFYSVADPQMRARILALRENPDMAADLAAAFTRANGDYLTARFGRMPSPGELYIAHFLGARGAERFFALGLSQPNAMAAQHFPRQAEANPSIFYENGRPRTIREVYRVLVARHDAPISPDAAFAAQELAQGSSVPVMLPSATMSFVDFYRAGQGGAPTPPIAAPAPAPAAGTRPSSADFASFFNRLLLP